MRRLILLFALLLGRGGQNPDLALFEYHGGPGGEIEGDDGVTLLVHDGRVRGGADEAVAAVLGVVGIQDDLVVCDVGQADLDVRIGMAGVGDRKANMSP